MNVKLNWLVRAKNPYFWIGLIGLFLTTIGVDASTLTSWTALIDSLVSVIQNPFLIGSLVLAFWGYVQDFTTKGFGDTDQAMTYTAPRKDSETVEDDDFEFIEKESEVE